MTRCDNCGKTKEEEMIKKGGGLFNICKQCYEVDGGYCEDCGKIPLKEEVEIGCGVTMCKTCRKKAEEFNDKNEENNTIADEKIINDEITIECDTGKKIKLTEYELLSFLNEYNYFLKEGGINTGTERFDEFQPNKKVDDATNKFIAELKERNEKMNKIL